MATQAICSKNNYLHEAKRNKNDEFYTQIQEIAQELKHYKSHFESKVIFCNCDDPEHSNFWKYFKEKFDELGLRRLISTHYKAEGETYKLEFDGKESIKTPLVGDGDFRSPEAVEILKEADIVVTNPPFSLFREYIAQLMEYDKKFVIIGNINALTYKDIFPLIKGNKVWLGCSIHGKKIEFMVPDWYPLKASGWRVDKQGNKYIFVKGVRWVTNLDVFKRHERLILYKHYTPEEYPKYDNYDAINVNKTSDIPLDYDGVMGVPITFIDKYNPEQFELLGITNTGEKTKA